MERYTEELLNRGIIYFTGVVTQESMQALAEKLLKLDIDRNFDGSIALNINSPGGDLAACFGVLDVISNMRLQVDTFGVGEICSCGLLLFLAGRNRYITPNTSILSHQYYWGARGKHHELKGIRKEQDMCYERLVRYYKERLGLSRKIIKAKLLPSTDVWLTTEEALKYRVATGVIKSRKVITAKYSKIKRKK